MSQENANMLMQMEHLNCDKAELQDKERALSQQLEQAKAENTVIAAQAVGRRKLSSDGQPGVNGDDDSRQSGLLGYLSIKRKRPKSKRAIETGRKAIFVGAAGLLMLFLRSRKQ
eukprot:gnl/MRDRNA2_/MRDRNA2_68474_c0_seq2.p1 gnl/MRDRNA2_/MRDRNA2_68474_c0~~gnl/MRDRNA2_/MRDRNA2_68474_c0_seq2.p1  ORF type:complete len:123 (-),score=31.18 gnl/MRDRNA2_/MRDRNA2_68474_c0_seq2:19-360(-)